MKNFKTPFTLLLLLVLVIPIASYSFNQEVTTEVEESVSFGTFFLKLLWQLFPPILLGAFITAANHVTAWTMNWKLWFNDTALPSLIAYIIAVVLGVIDYQVAIVDTIIEAIFQIKTDVNDIEGLAIVAIALVPFIKGLTKRQHTKEKVEVKEIDTK